jgi:hypothetical protein
MTSRSIIELSPGNRFQKFPAAVSLAFRRKTMKRLKQLSMAVAVSLMLAMSAVAGEIEIPVAPPQPGSSSAAAPSENEIPGIIHTPGAPSGSAAEVALNLLLSAMSVF